jgi:ABC-2 type transport system permease protein
LTLRQLTGKWRLIIIIVLGALPILPVTVSAIVDDRPDCEDLQQGQVVQRGFNSDDCVSHRIEETDDVLIKALLASAVLPLITLSIATASLGNELEDKTLGFLVLNPLARWKIVLPKMLAALSISAPVLLLSGGISAFIAYDGDMAAVTAVAIGIAAGATAYTAVFLWAGLMTSRALAIGLLYVFLWEGLFATFVAGIRNLSIREYTIGVIKAIDDTRFSAPGQETVSTTMGIAGIAAIIVIFLALTVRRLSRMDVP